VESCVYRRCWLYQGASARLASAADAVEAGKCMRCMRQPCTGFAREAELQTGNIFKGCGGG